MRLTRKELFQIVQHRCSWRGRGEEEIAEIQKPEGLCVNRITCCDRQCPAVDAAEGTNEAECDIELDSNGEPMATRAIEKGELVTTSWPAFLELMKQKRPAACPRIVEEDE